MAAVIFSESDFYHQRQLADRRWGLASMLAVAVHFSVVICAVYAPSFLERKPLLDDVITVNLVSLPPSVTKQPPVERPVQKKITPVQPETAQPVPEIPDVAEVHISTPILPEPEPVAAANPISVKPRKLKIKKAKDTRLAEERERQQRAADIRRREQERQAAQRREIKRQQQQRIQQQRIAQAKREQQRAEELARRAREELASVLKERQASGSMPQRSSSRSSSAAGNNVTSIVEKQYLSALHQQVHSYWILPEMRKWDRSLETIVVVTINRDGRVLNTLFERKSRDPVFDQFVVKTLHRAAPMPPFPKLMKKATIEVGIRFRPGELVM